MRHTCSQQVHAAVLERRELLRRRLLELNLRGEVEAREARALHALPRLLDHLRARVQADYAFDGRELDRRLAPAGVSVDDARLTHLAYAPEIAQAMLRRQQAEAIIAARKKIVEGAVSMVDMALKELSDGGVVEFDEDRKAVMASNLMVVLCGESEAQPVLNTGSLYQ